MSTIPMPKARRAGLIVEELDDETLVYDAKTHEAHCLNRSAALVWRSADGATPVPEIAARLREVGLPDDENVVWMALGRLRKANLLEDTGPASNGARRVTRKEVLRSLGHVAGLAVVLPAVATILTPIPAQAASCIPLSQCQGSQPPNCTGLPICENRYRCCVDWHRRCRPRNC